MSRINELVPRRRIAMCARLAGVAWEQVAADVRPFLKPGAAVPTEDLVRKAVGEIMAEDKN